MVPEGHPTPLSQPALAGLSRDKKPSRDREGAGSFDASSAHVEDWSLPVVQPLDASVLIDALPETVFGRTRSLTVAARSVLRRSSSNPRLAC